MEYPGYVMIPPCVGLPDSMLAALSRAAEEWFASPERPRPSDDVVRHWDALIHEWVHDPKLPLLVRKSADRGCEQEHAGSGRVIVCTDNSPAHWALASAISGDKPDVRQLLEALESGEWPVVFALSKVEAAKLPRYRGVMARSKLGKALNVAGWKVCHTHGVADGSRGADLEKLPLAALIEHSRRFLSPSNMFVVPNSHAGFGELREVREVFAGATTGKVQPACLTGDRNENVVREQAGADDQNSPGSAQRRWQVVPPIGEAIALPEVVALASGPDPGTKPIVSNRQGRTFVRYSRTRVWLDRDAWEALTKPDDVLVQRVRYPGKPIYAVALTRSELETVFGEVRHSESWNTVRCYHFPVEPPAIRSFRIVEDQGCSESRPGTPVSPTERQSLDVR